MCTYTLLAVHSKLRTHYYYLFTENDYVARKAKKMDCIQLYSYAYTTSYILVIAAWSSLQNDDSAKLKIGGRETDCNNERVC